MGTGIGPWCSLCSTTHGGMVLAPIRRTDPKRSGCSSKDAARPNCASRYRCCPTPEQHIRLRHDLAASPSIRTESIIKCIDQLPLPRIRFFCPRHHSTQTKGQPDSGIHWMARALPSTGTICVNYQSPQDFEAVSAGQGLCLPSRSTNIEYMTFLLPPLCDFSLLFDPILPLPLPNYFVTP